MTETALTLHQEQSLVRQSRVDARAFGALYDHYFPRIYNYVYFRVQDQATSDDLVSTIFMRALDRLDTYREERGAFGVWLFRIAHNAVVDHYRSAARQALPLEQVEPLVSDDPPVEQRLVQQQQTLALLAQVARLPEREQEIIRLKFLGGLGNKEIAKVIHLRPGHVAVILYRALRQLRTLLEAAESRTSS